MELAKRRGLKDVYIHLLDGRDVPPSSGKDYVQECADKLKEIGVGKIATVMGRYYAMDRDNRWDRGKGLCRHSLRRGRPGTVPCGGGGRQLRQGGYRRIRGARRVRRRRSDRRRGLVVFFNFRPDRPGNHPHLVDPAFKGFERKKAS